MYMISKAEYTAIHSDSATHSEIISNILTAGLYLYLTHIQRLEVQFVQSGTSVFYAFAIYYC